MIRFAIIAAGGFLLAGCVAPMAVGLGAAAGVAQVPGWISVAQDAIAGVKTLSAAAQLACSLQSYANARGDSALSAAAGGGCSW